MNKDNMNELKKEYDNIEVPPEVDLAIEKGIKKGKNYKRKNRIKPFAVIAAGIVLALGIASSANLVSTNDIPLIALRSIEPLPIVGSSENLQKLLKTYISQNNGILYDGATNAGAPINEAVKKSSIGSGKNTSFAGDLSITTNYSIDKNASITAEKSTQSSAKNDSSDHSTTNLQVQGVDEEDLVKTDGEYIFKVNAQKIINVIKVAEDSNMEAVKDITFEEDYNINGIFLRKNILVVVGNRYQNVEPSKGEQNKSYDMRMTSYGVTKVISFDISDKRNIVKVRDIEIDGFYNSARMIDSRVYIITNKYLNNISNIEQDINVGNVYYRDSAVGTEKVKIDFNSISYLPDFIEPNYIMVAAFNVDDNSEKVNISTILGSGDNIYSSDKNLYISGTTWIQDRAKNGTSNTILYKFQYENTGVKFVAKGEVPGNIINQFSMDEKNDYFRVATTEYKYSIVGPTIDEKSTAKNNGSTTSAAPTDKKVSSELQNQITNNLYILDKDMKVVGKLEGIANGEKIYSVRFIGERAYIVTFMLTDPLFVIDLKNPTSPKILGELKIPGFSNYLHHYDDTHLIGFGMDTTVINERGTDRAKTKGMKIAIFDVSNVLKPVQQFMTTIGGMGTYSEVLNNHKALLFSKEKNLLALPVTENNYDNNTIGSQQSYQGAYIYNIDLVNGIKLKGKITHTDEATSSNKNNSTKDYSMFNGQYFVDRILYIKDTLYTLSNRLIKANDINTLKEKSKLNLKTFDYSKAYLEDGIRKVTPSQSPETKK
jgi:inhibitor of cysteine peptidase